jgi:flagellar biosynthesis protein FlhG
MTEKSIRTLSFTSGKGGVGKTTLTVNVAYCLAQLGKKVLILDGDMSLANVDIFLKKTPEYSLNDFFEGRATLPELVVKYSKNLHILPGASGMIQMTQIDNFQKKMLIDSVSQLEGDYDYLLIDTASGIADEVLYLNSAAQEMYVVIQPDPSSLTDSYALMKLMNQKYRVKSFNVVTNQVLNEDEGLKVFHRMNSVTAKFLNVNLSYAGSVPFDLKVRQANLRQELIAASGAQSSSSYNIKKIADMINKTPAREESRGGLQFFWNQALHIA